MKSDNVFKRKAPVRQGTRTSLAWVIDFMIIDVATRPCVMLAADVATRQPLDVTIGSAASESINPMLDRMFQRVGRPEEIWMDHSVAYFSPGDLSLRARLERDGVLLRHVSTFQTRAIAGPAIRQLGEVLRVTRSRTLTDLRHDVKRWRQLINAISFA